MLELRGIYGRIAFIDASRRLGELFLNLKSTLSLDSIFELPRSQEINHPLSSPLRQKELHNPDMFFFFILSMSLQLDSIHHL